MSSGGAPVSYRTQVNRAITKRWAEAKQISYEGNDWGDDDDGYYESAPSSARGGQQSSWSAPAASAPRSYAQQLQQGMSQDSRNFTSPSPTRSNGRQSFDRGDDRRNFSAHAPSSSFEGPYPTAQQSPFPEYQYDSQQTHQEFPSRAYHGAPPLQIQTQARPQSRDRPPQVSTPSRDHAQYTRLPSTFDARGGPSQDAAGGITYGDGGRRSESSGRPSLSDLQGRSESPYRTMNPPMSTRSQHSRDDSPAKRFPPRKSSLSQDTSILEPSLQPALSTLVTGGPPAPDNPKPLPIIRPSDIYKRMEEEREKERRSQESSRPSIDSDVSRPRERDIFTSARQSQDSSCPRVDPAAGMDRENYSPVRHHPSSSLHGSEQLPSQSKAAEGTEDIETTRKLRSTLDPVAERKSEYGFENLLNEAGADHPSSVHPATSASADRPTVLSASSTRSEQAEPLTALSASSNYSDRPDPITASSQSSEKSLPRFLPVVRGVSGFGTDFLGGSSTQRDNPPSDQRPVAEAEKVPSNRSAMSGPKSSSLQDDQDTVTMSAPSADPSSTEIRHNPSIGLRSVVQQGFDDSQDQVPQTPLSMDESVIRSDSASASEISPILSGASSSFPPGAGVHPSGNQHPSIAEAMEETGTNPLQSAMPQHTPLQEVAQTISEPTLPPPPPPPVKDGYRRDYSIPGPGSSQARSPLTVGTVGIPEAEHASKSSATPTDSKTPWRTPKTILGGPQNLESPNESPRTNEGLEDSALLSPPSTLPTVAGPSGKGTVRGIAEKIESRSGRASPAVSLDREQETSRPLHNRLESFRPSLPGGWQSYSTTADTPSLQQEQGSTVRGIEQASGPTSLLRNEAEDSPVSSEDDDLPTARPPKPRTDDSDYGPSKTAFAAAAAAGSALVGAFTAATGLGSQHNETARSHEVSEDESVTTDSFARDDFSREGLGNATSEDQADRLVPHPEERSLAPSPIAPSPPAKDTPSESDTPGSTLGYFPPPLRTSRTAEPVPPMTSDLSPPMRPPMLPALSSDTTMHDTENDRLRKEIVRSLTPKSTRNEGGSVRAFGDDPPLPQIPVVDEPRSSSLDTAAVSEPNGASTRKLNMEQDQNNLSQSQTPEVPITSGKVTPHPNTWAENGRVPDTAQARNIANLEDRPMLEQRFSWEPLPDTTPSASTEAADSNSARSPRTTQSARGESSSPETIKPHTQGNTPSVINALQVAPSIAPASTIQHAHNDPSSRYDDVPNDVGTLQQGDSREPSFRPGPTGLPATGLDPLSNTSAREMPFRDILALGTPQDRIQAYNANRGVLASQDTGLAEWLRAMGNQVPEHSDILRSNGRLSAHENENLVPFKSSPGRSKFQRLASLGNNNQSPDADNDPSISNSPSGGRANNLHMPGQGKKLLKDAGKIGGQAGVVAKGLFAKGKNKLRAGGGSSDKGILAGRRRSSQPMIVTDESQHSSVAPNAAPQIPNLKISPIESEEHWYNPIDATSSPLPERSVSPINVIPRQESNGRDLVLPGHVDHPGQEIRQSSPRVSAVGSFHDGELPSRSISEVTRPTNSGDERSPIAAIPEDFIPSTVPENVAVDSSKQPRLTASTPTLAAGIAPTRVPTAPVSDALGPLPDLRGTPDVGPNPPTTESSVVDQDLSPERDLTPRAHDHEAGALGSASDPFATIQSNAKPAQAATLNQESGLSSEEAEAALPVVNRGPNSEDEPQSGLVASNTTDEVSQPSHAGATPPYTEPDLSKEAEAAMYRSPLNQTGDVVDSLPAYQSNQESGQTTSKPLVGKGDVIVPVTDLSHRRQASSSPAQSRPFSFVAGDTLLSRGHIPAEQTATASAAPFVQPDLAKEISVANSDGGRGSLDLVKRKSKSYSRPFVTDPDVRDHPAYRQSQDMARNKETFMPSDRSEKPEPVNNRPLQPGNDDGQYRIPGPYVQEYRSPKQPPQALAAKQLPPPQSPSQEQPTQSLAPGTDPLRSHDPRDANQIRPAGQPLDSNMVHSTEAVTSPINERPRQQSKSGLFRTRSKSRSVNSRNEESHNAANKSEKRGGFFKQRPRGDAPGMHRQLGSLRGNSGDAVDRQRSREGVDDEAVNGERADQIGDLRKSSSTQPLQSDAKKKRFSGLGSLFGRSGKSGMKTSTSPQGSQPVQRASILSNSLLGKPDVSSQQNAAIPDSMYAQNDQRGQTFPQQDQSRNYSQSKPGFQGLNPPIGGYYAPNQQQEAASPIMPHDPDSFSRGRFSAEQQSRPGFHPGQPSQGSYQVPYHPISQPFDQQLPSQISQPEESRPPLQINTNTNQPRNRSSLNNQVATAPPALPPRFPPTSQLSPEPPRQVSYHNSQRPTQEAMFDSRPRSRSPYAYGGSPGTNQSAANHVIDLHKRSRSPRNGRRPSEDEQVEEVNRNDPASQLGTFSNIAAPRSGGADSSEQEAPWRIGLPNSEEEETKRKSQATVLERERERAAPGKTKAQDNKPLSVPVENPDKDNEVENVYPRKSEEEWRRQEQEQEQPHHHEPTIAEKVMGVHLSRGPLQRNTSAANANANGNSRTNPSSKMSPVELPGSRAPGDDSDDEIVMSSTAYPGQEWAPDNWGYGGGWDD